MIAIKVLIRSVFMNGNILFPIIIAVVFVLFVTIVRSKRIKKADYDERQLLARNTAYKVAFFFLLIYCFVCGLLHIFDFKWADTTIQMFLGIIISFSLFIALCIIKDAFFSNSSKQNNYSVIFFSRTASCVFYISCRVSVPDKRFGKREKCQYSFCI